MKTKTFLFLFSLIVLGSPLDSYSFTAPDTSQPGPYSVHSTSYKLPAEHYPEVHHDVTELWGKIWLPQIRGERPLVVFSHLATASTCRDAETKTLVNNCDYSYTGQCPEGLEPVPLHEGYSYLAEHLASHGYAVLSINMNRGINCNFNETPASDALLTLARGRLILRNLEELYKWNKGTHSLPEEIEIPLQNRIDFSKISMIGHSRGTESTKTAHYQYHLEDSIWPSRLPVFGVRSILDIDPVAPLEPSDLFTQGLHWAALVGGCSGMPFTNTAAALYDTSIANRAANRRKFRGYVVIGGANHYPFNSVMTSHYPSGCIGSVPALFTHDIPGSPSQRAITQYFISAYVRGTIENDLSLLNAFNPRFELPEAIKQLSTFQRTSVIVGANQILDDFSHSDYANSQSNEPWYFTNISIHKTATVPESDPSLHGTQVITHDVPALRLQWDFRGSSEPQSGYFETRIDETGQGRDLSRQQTIDLRVVRQPQFCQENSYPYNYIIPNPIGIPTDFTISLIDSNGNHSLALQVSQYATISDPGGWGTTDPSYHAECSQMNLLLQAVRVPLSDFEQVDVTQIQSIRLNFDSSLSEYGDMYISELETSAYDGTTASQ